MNAAYTALVLIVWFFSTYFVLVFLFYMIKYRRKLKLSPGLTKGNLPKVTLVLPAFNEERAIEESILSLKKLDYPKHLLEIIIVNDGSKDNTRRIVSKYADGKQIIFIDNKLNKGKAACLNEGIARARGEFVACMDADSILSENILKKTIPYFINPKIGAVTVSVLVNKPKNLLEKIVEIEYIIGLSLFLKVFSFFNCIFVTPGPFSIYRKNMLNEIGGFDTKNITEDLEIAYRIHKAGYRIDNCMSTNVKTYLPETFKGLYIQRKRWYSGAILTAWQHRSMLFKRKYGIFSFFIPFNYALIGLGLFLFGYSMVLFAKNMIKSLLLFSLTNYNFLDYLNFQNIDFRSISVFSFFGTTAFIMTIIITLIGFRISGIRLREKLKGFIGFPYIFILYQIFWTSSAINVALKRKIKWR